MRHISGWFTLLAASALVAVSMAACAGDPGALGSATSSSPSGTPVGATSGGATSPTPQVAPTTPRPPHTPPGPGPVPPLPPLVVSRSGGLTGLMQEISLDVDGSWTFTDERNGAVERGRLSASQRQQLARLAADPALAQELRRNPPAGACSDAFVYTVLVGDLSFRFEQCGGPSNRPVADALLNLIIEATPL